MRPSAILIFAIPFISLRAQAAEPVLIAYDFHITEGGGFIEHTVPQIGTSEFEGIMSGACAAFGDCSKLAGQIRWGAEAITPALQSHGKNHSITGRVTEHDGEAWYGSFDPIQGYEVCNAGLEYGSMSVTGGTAFSTQIRRTGADPGLGFYAVVPQNRSDGRKWIDARIVIKWVPTGTFAQHRCAPDGSYPWICKGQECDPLTRAYLLEPSDPNLRRKLKGKYRVHLGNAGGCDGRTNTDPAELASIDDNLMATNECKQTYPILIPHDHTHGTWGKPVQDITLHIGSGGHVWITEDRAGGNSWEKVE